MDLIVTLLQVILQAIGIVVAFLLAVSCIFAIVLGILIFAEIWKDKRNGGGRNG